MHEVCGFCKKQFFPGLLATAERVVTATMPLKATAKQVNNNIRRRVTMLLRATATRRRARRAAAMRKVGMIGLSS